MAKSPGLKGSWDWGFGVRFAPNTVPVRQAWEAQVQSGFSLPRVTAKYMEIGTLLVFNKLTMLLRFRPGNSREGNGKTLGQNAHSWGECPIGLNYALAHLMVKGGESVR